MTPTTPDDRSASPPNLRPHPPLMHRSPRAPARPSQQKADVRDAVLKQPLTAPLVLLTDAITLGILITLAPLGRALAACVGVLCTMLAALYRQFSSAVRACRRCYRRSVPASAVVTCDLASLSTRTKPRTTDTKMQRPRPHPLALGRSANGTLVSDLSRGESAASLFSTATATDHPSNTSRDVLVSSSPRGTTDVELTLGLSAYAIRAFLAAHHIPHDWTCSEVVREYIKPLTAAQPGPYTALLQDAVDDQGHPLVAKGTLMLSHTWRYPFHLPIEVALKTLDRLQLESAAPQYLIMVSSSTGGRPTTVRLMTA